MVAGIAVWFGFAAVLIMLAAVLGSVEQRARFGFVVGVALVLLGLTVVTTPRTASVLLILVGFGAVFGSTVPLLR